MPWKERLPLHGRKTESRVLETDVESRQGPRGRPVLLVLIGSGVLLGLYLVGMMIWTFASSPETPSTGAALPEVRSTGDINAREPGQSEVPPANPAYPAPAAK